MCVILHLIFTAYKYYSYAKSVLRILTVLKYLIPSFFSCCSWFKAKGISRLVRCLIAVGESSEWSMVSGE